MDQHSLNVLEYNRICEFLASFAATPGGRRLCRDLQPARERDGALELLQETSEMKLTVESDGPLPLGGAYDIRKAVAQARIRDYYLDQQDLLRIMDTLETAQAIKKFCSGIEDTRPLICTMTGGIIPLGHITARIHKSISPQGEVLDTASPELAEIRKRLKSLRAAIMKTLEKLMGDEHIQHAFQDDFITQRNNRYVIPVRTDSKGAVPGVVHDQSQSKATFFIEPLSVVNLNNELQGLQKEQYYEEIRILTELTNLVDSCRDEILTNLAIVERVDVIHARALFSRALHATAPRLSTDGTIRLCSCRHPILQARFVRPEPPDGEEPGDDVPGSWEFTRPGVVPIDIIKDRKTTTMIITGANAGGKTVALKTLGLFVLMAQAGMHLPVREQSTVAVFEHVYADIGDEQNIATSLSTFSAHMSRIRSIVSSVTAASLVLLDELGSGTDPVEGGALAVAILDFLRRRGSGTITTTHLNMLKTYAYSHADVQNVSVEFDPETLRPQYSLVYGVPGISNALAIAGNMGLPDEILDNARNNLGQADRHLAELMQGLEKNRQEISRARAALDRVRQQASAHQGVAEKLLASIQDRQQDILKDLAHKARKLLNDSEAQLKQLIREQKKRHLVRPGHDEQRRQDAKAAFSSIKTRLESRFPAARPPHTPVEHVEVGQRVKIPHLQKTGVVTAVNNQARKADISVGGMKIQAGFQKLQALDGQAPRDEIKVEKSPGRVYNIEAQTASCPKVTVIGMRVDEALPVVDKAIDNAILSGAETLEIIHGRGTGTLMNAIHTFLRDHYSVRRFETGNPSRGGSGLTIVHL